MNKILRPRNTEDCLTHFTPRLNPKTHNILDLGSGTRKLGTIGIDFIGDPDIKHNLDKPPYPFKDSTFDEIFANATFEYLSNITEIIEECYRLLKPTGLLTIGVPYYASITAWLDPNHKSYYSEHSFNKYLSERPDLNFETKARFKMQRILFALNFSIIYRFLPFRIIKNFMPHGIYGLVFWLKKDNYV